MRDPFFVFRERLDGLRGNFLHALGPLTCVFYAEVCALRAHVRSSFPYYKFVGTHWRKKYLLFFIIIFSI